MNLRKFLRLNNIMEMVKTELKKSDPPKQLKSGTRQWNSGRIKFAVIGWKDKPEKNYIIFEKSFYGKTQWPDQKFNLRYIDWNNLKKLIDEELNQDTKWEQKVAVIDQNSLSTLIQKDPDIIEKVLSNKNILKLSDASLESLDQLAVRLYEVKTEKIDLILKELARSSSADIEKFSNLLEDLRLNQVSMMASIIYQKLKVIDLLEKTCRNKEKLERDVHTIFEKHCWLVGKGYEIVQSDKPLSQYLDENLQNDPETRKRPDLIVKKIPYVDEVILIELKAPGVKLKAQHVGQVLTYKSLIEQNKPNIKEIHCFIFGYEKDKTFSLSRDVKIKTFSELISEIKEEYQEYQKVLEEGKEINKDMPF
ncbi:hypothetical protein COW98_04915 [Candidatus Roizmanbacteria bacterium CG22_combo_CG10-13_8_21_14_all_35_9]|uniref:Uncharacterized protein n=1 Tax=Candidatus Roizmanbacteria bacterium CG22_combo_CG10-13_8_21_14_all_35_9 TaxID=1974861 RepID=A0A2H0BXM1_9BACT|nr:MAG: hypothetical protein COW98_04915 [Candidatus Roizmanbacteria bacterium CG22_combo_CG10-13_8_21_14_all_35_9]